MHRDGREDNDIEARVVAAVAAIGRPVAPLLRLAVVVRLRREIALWRWRRERSRPRGARPRAGRRRRGRAYMFEAHRPQAPVRVEPF